MNKEYKPEYFKEEKYGTDIPGLGPEKLDSNVSIRDGGTGGQAETIGIQINGADYIIGDIITFNGFGFTPKKVMIQGAGSVGIGYFNANGDKRDNTTTQTAESGFLIYLESGTSIFQALLVDFTTDGFRVEVSNKTNDFFFFYATCFSNI